MSERISAERGARNQAFFRRVNEKVGEVNRIFEELARDDPEGFVCDWVCECVDDDCGSRIQATVAEYESVRAKPTTFFVFPGHVYPEIERTVEQNERYEVVEKIGNAGEIAAEPYSRPFNAVAD